MFKKIQDLEEVESDIVYILIDGSDMFFSDSVHRHKLYIVEESEEYYKVSQSPIYKVSKKRVIKDDSESAYELIKARIEKGITKISKSFKNKYPDVIKKIKEEFPQYFI